MPFDFAPFLDGQNVTLRPLVPADRDALQAVASDPLIWEVHPTPTRWQRPVFDALFDETMAEGGGMAIHDRVTGILIGSSRFSVRYAEPGEAEIGWTFLARSYWGGATNRDVKRVMIAHALRFVDRVIFRVGIDNVRSRRAMEKIGGVEIRRWTDPAKPHVPEHVVYAVDRAGLAAL